MKKLPMGRRRARATIASLHRSHVMSRALSALGAPPAASPDWITAVTKLSPSGWLMFMNATYGCCVIADCAHQEMLRTANVGEFFEPTDAEVLALYAYFQGMNIDPSRPLTPAGLSAVNAYLANNDNGCDELTVIQYLTKTGWIGRKLDGSANLDPTQLDQLKWAVCIFGASRLGLNLPDSAQSQFEAGEPWDYAPGASLDGGHDVPLVQYNGNQYGVVTWGKLQPVTLAFLTAKYPDGTPYLEEAHVELAFDWVNQAGTCPDNLNLAQLVADLSSIMEPLQPPQPTPVPAPPSPPPSPIPPRPMSKAEFFKLIAMADASDFHNLNMTVEDMAADIIKVCKMVMG